MVKKDNKDGQNKMKRESVGEYMDQVEKLLK